MAKTNKQRIQKARRLPSGLYRYRGKARHFSDLPEAEKHRFRSLWAVKAAATRARLRAVRIKTASLPKLESHWILRRGRRVGKRICLPVKDNRGIGDVLFRLRWAAEEYDHHGASYVATILWPDDLDKHGRPAISHASTRFRDDLEEGATDAKYLFEKIIEVPEILDRRPGRSGRPGRAEIVEICVWILIARGKGKKR